MIFDHDIGLNTQWQREDFQRWPITFVKSSLEPHPRVYRKVSIKYDIEFIRLLARKLPPKVITIDQSLSSESVERSQCTLDIESWHWAKQAITKVITFVISLITAPFVKSPMDQYIYYSWFQTETIFDTI